jgi:hypothetical protein
VCTEVIELLQQRPQLQADRSENRRNVQQLTLELGRTKQRVLQLEDVLRKLNKEARRASLRMSSREPAPEYGAIEYVMEMIDFMGVIKKQCQDSYLALQGVGLPADVGVLKFIQQCTSRIQHLNEKVDQSSKFRNATEALREEMLNYLQDENNRLQTAVNESGPVIERSCHEIRILRLTAMDAAMKHAARARLKIQEAENKRSRYNFLVLNTRRLFEFVNSIAVEYIENKLPQWIEREVLPNTWSYKTSVVSLELVQEVRLQAIALSLFLQQCNWPGSRPNWIPDGKVQKVDDHGRALQQILRLLTSALWEADLELSGGALED